MTRILFVSLFTATLTMTALSQTQNQPENAPVCSLSLSQAPVIFRQIIRQRAEADKQKGRAAFKP
jgi:hypothetical protein